MILKSGEAVAELDFKITEVDLSGVARGYPPQTPIKSIEMDMTEVAQGGLELELHEEEEEDDKCNFSAMLTRWNASPPR